MGNIWSKINDDVAIYMKKILEQYKMDCVKISQLKTAMIGKNFALIVSIDRFYTDILYLTKIDNKFVVLSCGNFFAEKYDANDRKDLLAGSSAEEQVINELKVTASGLISKWGNVLGGETQWLNDYQESKWYTIGRLTQDEMKIIQGYIC